MQAQVTTTPDVAPAIGDDIDTLGDSLADDILAKSVRDDKTTRKIMRGGTSAKFQPRSWSYGGAID